MHDGLGLGFGMEDVLGGGVGLGVLARVLGCGFWYWMLEIWIRKR